MQKFDVINWNINSQPIPSIFTEGYSQYETLTKLLYQINQYIENMNTASDEIDDLEEKKLAIEDYLDDIKNHRKLDEVGNFTGTWHGLEMHESDEGLASDWNNAKGIFNTVTDRLNNSDSNLTNVDSQLAENTQHQKIARHLEGTFDGGAVLGVISNEDNPLIQVSGFTSPDQTSLYTDRDSVALYVHNRSYVPTVSHSTGTITYGSNTVQVTGATISNLNKIKPNMVIDTMHTPNKFSSIVTSVNVATQTITVNTGWYEQINGGSTIPSIPTNNIGFTINSMSKIWGINNNVFLKDGDSVKKAVAEEIGLFDSTTYEDSQMGGIDIANFGKKAKYAYQARTNDGSIDGFTEAFKAHQSDTGFANYASDPSNFALKSFVSGESDDFGFGITCGGIQNKLKFYAKGYGNGETVAGVSKYRIHILNKTVLEDFTIISPINRNGEFLYILNSSNIGATLKIADTSKFLLNGTLVSSTVMSKHSNTTLISDGANWLILNGSFDDGSGYFDKRGGTIYGDTTVNTALNVGGALNVTGTIAGGSSITTTANIATLGTGLVKTQNHAWDSGHFVIGLYHLWVDSSGKLRIKNGAPTSDVDGTIVGTQT